VAAVDKVPAKKFVKKAVIVKAKCTTDKSVPLASGLLFPGKTGVVTDAELSCYHNYIVKVG